MTPPLPRSAAYSPTRRADCPTLAGWPSRNSFFASSKKPEAVARLIAELGLSDRHYFEYLAGEGREAYERCQQEAAADHVFGVPFFLFAGEAFWGYDRLALLEQRLEEAGLAIDHKVTAA
jgi:hypothetical protein